MITAIIFDWGGIFTSKKTLQEFCEMYCKKYHLDFAIFNAKRVELWEAAAVGKIDSSLFYSELSELAGISEEQFKQDVEEFSGFYPEVLDFVKERLKGKHKLGMITNQIEAWFETHIEHKKLNDIFDVIITSYESRSAKPDKKIFQDALQKLQATPAECIFIDDREKNILAASELGMHTILYDNLAQLKQELKKIGIDF